MTNTRKTLLLQGLTAVGGSACAMLLVALSGNFALSFSLTPVPEGFVASRAAHVTVYAPSAVAAREGQREVLHARERFHLLFGVSPADLVVVLVDDPGRFRHLDTAPFGHPKARFLPFVTPAHLHSARGESGTPETEVKPLAHEACHVYVGALADQIAAAPAGRRGYGHSALPDWFDEAAATLCESADARAVRRRQFRASLDRRIPLREFEGTPHPLRGEVWKRFGSDTLVGKVGVQVIPADQIRRLLPGTNAELFYSQALALGEFITEHGGPGVLGSLARALANGRTLDQALLEARRSAPGLPATVDELEVAWVHWVEHGGN